MLSTLRTVGQPLRPSNVRTLIGSSTSVGPALSEPFPGVPSQSYDGAKAAQDSQSARLDNQVTVITHGPKQNIARIRVAVQAGSRFETDGTVGHARFMKHMAFKSTLNRTEFRVWKDIEAVFPQSFDVNVGRESVNYDAKILSGGAGELLDVLGDIVLHGQFAYHEVRDTRARLRDDIMRAPAGEILSDAVHSAAYGFTGLGRSLVTPLDAVDDISFESVASYVKQLYVPSRITVVASGVDHAEFTQLAKSAFGSASSSQAGSPVALPEATEAVFHGGQTQVVTGGSGLHLALAFEVPKEAALVRVLEKVFGGGSPHVYDASQNVDSLLFQNIVAKNNGVAANVFASTYSDSGLFGIEASIERSSSATADQVLNAIVDQVKKAGSVSADDLARAKLLAKHDLLRAHEQTHVSKVGKQHLNTLVKEIDAVSAEDIKGVVRSLRSSNPALAVVGPAVNLPHVKDLAARLK